MDSVYKVTLKVGDARGPLSVTYTVKSKDVILAIERASDELRKRSDGYIFEVSVKELPKFLESRSTKIPII